MLRHLRPISVNAGGLALCSIKELGEIRGQSSRVCKEARALMKKGAPGLMTLCATLRSVVAPTEVGRIADL